MRSWIKACLLVLLGLLVIAGGLLAVHHLTGRAAFLRWQAERKAMGDKVDWADLRPAALPPDQNFAEAPLVRGAISAEGLADPRFKALALPESVTKALGDWREGRRDDLDAVAGALGPGGLRAAFKAREAGFRDLGRASRRPGSHILIAYEDGATPTLLGFRGATRALRLRALLNLRSGHPDLALDDVETAFRIARHLGAEPSLFCAMQAQAQLTLAMQAVWEGLEDHRWGPDHLARLQTLMGTVDLLAVSKLAWQGERQFSITALSAAAENRALGSLAGEPPKPRIGRLGRGWFYRNLLAECQWMTTLVELPDPAAHRVHAERIDALAAHERVLRYRPDLVLARIAIPSLAGQVVTFARTQALLDLARVACALERYRLAHGQFPERLEALQPELIPSMPRDLVHGGGLHYRREGASFRLYQVGWDGRDEGGAVAWKEVDGRRRQDPAKGDWVWPHAGT